MRQLLSLILLAGGMAAAGAAVPETLRTGGELVGEGRYAEALPLLEQAIEDTRLQDPELTPAAMNLLARANQGLGRYPNAEEWYRRAIGAYEKADRLDPRIAVVLANQLSLYVEQGHAGPGRLVADRLERLPPGQLPALPDHRRHVLSILAAFRLAIGEDQLAAATLERALAIPGGTDAAQEAVILNDLGSLAAQAGRLDEATAYLTRALETLERGVGPDHPLVVQVLQNLAVSYYQGHQSRDALTTYDRALSLVERRFPETHPLQITIRLAYAKVLRKCGQKSEAKRLETEARRIRVEPAGDRSPHLVDVTELRARRGR